MTTFLTKLQGLLDKPVVKKITGTLLEDAIPKVRTRVGEDPVIALGGLATFLAWLASKLPAKVATPVQGVVMLLGLVGAKATVTPIAAPKVVVTMPVAVPSSDVPVGKVPAGAPVSAPAAPKVKVTIPLVPAAREAVQSAITGALATIRGK